jgi:hypothetical protein
MLRTKLFVLSVCVFSAFAQQSSQPAQTVGSENRNWSGTLVDATRMDCGAEVEHAVKPGMCPVSMCTKTFGLMMADGKFAKFDEGGNAKAIDALRKSTKASKIIFNYWRTGKIATAIKARVTGTMTSDVLNVESVKTD